MFSFLGTFHLVDLQAGFDDEVNFARLLHAITGDADASDEPASVACPYVDLHAFTARERHHFFGREKQTEAIVARLMEEPLLAVLGPSGSGKSSLVKAGVIPAAEERLPGLPVTVFRPGPHPFEAAALALKGYRGGSSPPRRSISCAPIRGRCICPWQAPREPLRPRLP